MDGPAPSGLLCPLCGSSRSYGGSRDAAHAIDADDGVCAATNLLAPAAAHAQIDDRIRGAASEANHFIETPRGWQHPLTEWGEPDIRAQLNQMQAAGIPLERCATSYRAASSPGAGAAGFGAPAEPCDMKKVWLTDAEYAQRMAEFRGSVDPSRQFAEQGNLGRAMLTGLMDPNIPQRQTTLIMSPADGLLPALTSEGKRRALLAKSDWALPGETIASTAPTTSLASEIKQWLGDSRGRWEGTTLVVETTNYREGPPLINLAVVGSPPGNRFPYSDQMRTTERVVRLNDDTWLYEITTEDPVILTAPFTVRFPMHDDASYFTPEYACHEDNVIVQNYVSASRHERANPTPEPPQPPVQVAAGVADALAGRWVGRPSIKTIDVDIELTFTKNADGTVNGKLIGTNLGRIDRALRDFAILDDVVYFTLPNVDPWRFSGNLSEGAMTGVIASAQGGVPVIFRKRPPGDR